MSNETKSFVSRSIKLQCLGQEIVSIAGLVVAARSLKRIDAVLRQGPDRLLGNPIGSLMFGSTGPHWPVDYPQKRDPPFDCCFH